MTGRASEVAVRSQTAIFSRLVKDFMRRVPLAVTAGNSCADVIAAMAARMASSATVTDAEGRPLGIITERDLTHRVAFRVPPETPVEKVMTTPVMTIAGDEYLYYAIARMRRRGLRHMPVVDGGGALTGMLNLHDALAVASDQLMGQIDTLAREDSIEGMKQIKAAQVELADQLFEDNLPAPDIQALLTHINNDIYRRIVDLNRGAMEAEGYGRPPVEFCVIVMGSGGRGENYLYPDQDNGFILEDYPDERHTEIEAWFIELAERMVRDLDCVGFPLCKGYVMATNPLWRKTLPQWIEQINLWGRKRNFVALRLADIFFDFQPVRGHPDMAARLRRSVTKMARSNHFFLQQMFQEEADHNVALGFFGGLLTEKKKRYKGQVNLKHTGTLPLVEAVRLLALREGVEETGTVRRIKALAAKGVLDANEDEELTSAFRLITGILLSRQIKDFQADTGVSYYVDPKALSKRTRSLLLDALKAIDTFRQRVRADFTADIF